jgi:hypothetical protein
MLNLLSVLTGSVWDEDFDPVMVSQRSIYKKDFQAAMDRYTA